VNLRSGRSAIRRLRRLGRRESGCCCASSSFDLLHGVHGKTDESVFKRSGRAGVRRELEQSSGKGQESHRCGLMGGEVFWPGLQGADVCFERFTLGGVPVICEFESLLIGFEPLDLGGAGGKAG
jgi:hypothetical protein